MCSEIPETESRLAVQDPSKSESTAQKSGCQHGRNGNELWYTESEECCLYCIAFRTVVVVRLGYVLAPNGIVTVTTYEDRIADEDLGLLPHPGTALHTMHHLNWHCTEYAVVAGIILRGGLSEDSILGGTIGLAISRMIVSRYHEKSSPAMT